MAKRTLVQCSKCQSMVELEERSLRRYIRKNETNDYVCFACINKVSAARPVSDKERQERAKRARTLWNNEEYRNKVQNSVKVVASSEDFKNKVSNNNKQRWRDEEYRKKMSELHNDPNYRAKLSQKAQEKWEDDEYRKRVLENKFNKDDLQP